MGNSSLPCPYKAGINSEEVIDVLIIQVTFSN